MLLAPPLVWTSVLLFGLASSQYFPPTPEGLSLVESNFGDNITISYKEVIQAPVTS
jgi:hypothetical protein